MWITANFRDDGIPKIDLSPTLNITRVSDNMPVVSSGVMLEMRDGSYKYDFIEYEITEDYVTLCDGGPTLSNYERYTDGASGEYNNSLYSIDTTVSGIDVKVDSIESTVNAIDVRTILIRKIQTNKLQLVDGSVGNWILYDDDNLTPLLVFSVADKNGNAIVQPTGVPSKRSKGI